MKERKKKPHINFIVEADLKEKAEELFNKLGMNMTGALTIFLRQCVIEQGIPFRLGMKEWYWEKVDMGVKE